MTPSVRSPTARSAMMFCSAVYDRSVSMNIPENRQVIRVNYGALNVEEFGSVYEGLLEYEPVFNADGNRIRV